MKLPNILTLLKIRLKPHQIAIFLPVVEFSQQNAAEVRRSLHRTIMPQH